MCGNEGHEQHVCDCECGCGSECECGCHQGQFQRRYQTKAEQIAELEEYMADLRK